MDNSKFNNFDYTLLAKYLSGEATPEEAIEVDDWIMSSENNRLLFEQASTAWQGNAPFQAGHAIKPLKRTIYLYRVGIAASLLLLAGALWLLVRPDQKSPPGHIISDAVSSVTKWAHKDILRDTLPDNSIVVQSTNSVLQYASDFSTGNREVHLAGEAWFNVTPNKAKPFLLHIGNLRVTVLGTSFNVQQGPSKIEISVKTGSVMMWVHSDSLSDSLIVKAGQQGIYDIKENKFILFNSFNINDQAYATKILSFENSTLKEIVAQVEKAYGIRVVFLNEKLKNLTMSSSFDNNSIEYIFEVISITLHVNYKIKNNVVYISSS
ncbi:MAG: FecR family protein [Chitinophagaceae bacterium]|nr:FecR family protein [Chitinophagaceae bacterium]